MGLNQYYVYFSTLKSNQWGQFNSSGDSTQFNVTLPLTYPKGQYTALGLYTGINTVAINRTSSSMFRIDKGIAGPGGLCWWDAIGY